MSKIKVWCNKMLYLKGMLLLDLPVTSQWMPPPCSRLFLGCITRSTLIVYMVNGNRDGHQMEATGRRMQRSLDNGGSIGKERAGPDGEIRL